MNKLIIIFVMVLTGINLMGQSVEDLVVLANAYNPSIKALDLEYEAALYTIDQKGEFPDPKVNLGLGVLPIETRLGAQRFKLGVSQAIPWKGLLIAQKELAKAQADIMSSLGDIQKINIEYAIRTAYSTLLFIDEKKEIIVRRFEVLDILEELSKSAVRSGKGKLSNVLLIQRKREILEEDIKILDKQKEQPTIMINRWTGRPFDTPILVEENDISISSMDQYLSYSETDHPQLKVLGSKVIALDKSSSLTYLEQKPKIGVGLDYALIDDRNDVDIPRNGRDVLMPMASISIPLNISRFEAKRKENQSKQVAIKARADELKDMFKAEISQAQSMIELAELSIQKSEKLKVITRETLKLMRTEYASEGRRFEELLRLEMELIDYDMETVKALFQKSLGQSVLLKYQ